MEFKVKYLILLVALCSCKVSNISNEIYEDISTRSINIKDFGAIANDNQDDSKAIQKAIDYAIASNKKSHIYCPPGIYILSKGVVIAQRKKDNNYFFTTLTISGHIPAYSKDQRIGNTTVFQLEKPTFGIAIQSARNSVIENIVFTGTAQYDNKIEHIIKWTDEQWSKNVRTDKYSPSCAIVIDPFHSNVPKESQYPEHKNYYSNIEKSGTSLLTIKGCSFSQHYIAIANNPSANNANGDNIRVEQSHVSSCHTFWSAGQTQSRTNSIHNVYALYLNTLVSGTQIGSQQGSPPTISNLNLAGFCKQLIDIKTGFSGFSMSQSYLENIWSLGIGICSFISFNQCQIKFHMANKISRSPSLHLYSNNTVAFRDCSLEFFSNCTFKAPFKFFADKIIVSGGQIEGGNIFTKGSNNGMIENVTFENVKNKCDKTVLSNVLNEHNSKKLRSPQRINYSTSNSEDVLIQAKKSDSEAYFRSKDPDFFKIGDNLLSNSTIVSNEFNQKNINIKAVIGFVSRKKDNTIYIKGFSEQVLNKSLKVVTVEIKGGI